MYCTDCEAIGLLRGGATVPLCEVIVRTIHLFVQLHYNILEEGRELGLHLGLRLGASLEGREG